MSVDSAIAYFRQRQQDLFRDQATVHRPTGTSTFNPTTGAEEPDAPTLMYSGECLIRGMTWEGTDDEVGGDAIRFRAYQIKFPPNTDVEIYDIVTPAASIYDSSLVGRSFWVTDVGRDGWQISRWTICREVTGDG
jgi:hypothetical protein